VLRTYELVYVFVVSYTPYCYIVELSTGNSKQDIYSHTITVHVVTPDYAGVITNCDVHCWLIPRYGPVRVVPRIRYGLVCVVRVDIKIPFSTRT